MLTLNRGGPVFGFKRRRRAKGTADNDWVELFNTNGAIAARAWYFQHSRVVS